MPCDWPRPLTSEAQRRGVGWAGHRDCDKLRNSVWAGGVVRDEPSADQREQLKQIGVASGLGCSIVVSIIIFIGGGLLLDRQFETSPVLTLIGVAIGLIAAGYQLYELALVGRRDRAPGPLGRRLASASGRRAGRSGIGEE